MLTAKELLEEHVRLPSETSAEDGCLVCEEPRRDCRCLGRGRHHGALAPCSGHLFSEVYHIPEHQIPADLKADKPRPEAWGEFVAPRLERKAFMTVLFGAP